MHSAVRAVAMSGLAMCALSAAAQHGDHSAAPQQQNHLGKVVFPTSCDPKVQAQFNDGVAMLHSYWFGGAAGAFKSVLEKDPSCAIAYWGIAIDLLGNSLAGAPSAQNAQQAWAMLEKAREVGAKTARERDWIDALSGRIDDRLAHEFALRRRKG